MNGRTQENKLSASLLQVLPRTLLAKGACSAPTPKKYIKEKMRGYRYSPTLDPIPEDLNPDFQPLSPEPGVGF